MKLAVLEIFCKDRMLLKLTARMKQGEDNSSTLTVGEKVAVEKAEESEAFPRVGRLLLETSVHVDSEQRPEHLVVFKQNVSKPCERLQTI